MDHHLIRVVSALCEDVATPRALAVKLLVQNGEWTQLLKLRVRPQDYSDSESYWKDAIVTDLLRKCDMVTDVDKEAAAEDTFLLCEKQNASTNARLSRFNPHDPLLEDRVDERVFEFISQWRKDISSILGNLPDHLTPRFSGGATYGDTGLLITTPDKMSSAPTITPGARCLLPFWEETLWSHALVKDRPWISDPATVRGNVFFTVPKDAEKHRGCCKEPSINVGLQLDVGRHMKNRLRDTIGIDLRTGQNLHRQLAREASVDGRLATIDMSNASDTLCRVLPSLVLRSDWLELLSSLRATHTRFKGTWYRLEKFSSMGNGFTFELESLIFATLARLVVRQEGGDPDVVKCYGDDLIVPVENAKGILAALALFGFTPNRKKTFTEGPFRESCGGDFFNGTPVRAHFIEVLPDEPQQWISLANGIRRLAGTNPSTSPRWAIVRRAWLRVLDAIPSDIRRCRGPEHLGDVVIHDDPSRWTICPIKPRKRWVRCHQSGRKLWLDDGSGPDVDGVMAYMPIPSVLPWNNWNPAVVLACSTLGMPSRGVTPRGGISGYRLSRIPCWYTSHWEPKARLVR